MPLSHLSLAIHNADDPGRDVGVLLSGRMSCLAQQYRRRLCGHVTGERLAHTPVNVRLTLFTFLHLLLSSVPDSAHEHFGR